MAFVWFMFEGLELLKSPLEDTNFDRAQNQTTQTKPKTQIKPNKKPLAQN